MEKVKTNREEASNEPITYLKLPYFNENQRRKIITAQRKTGLLGLIRVIFTTERPLARQFRDHKVLQQCPKSCKACKTSVFKGNCFKKYVIYKLVCNHCGKIYIGQTNRTIRSRILEHTSSKSSHVFIHMLEHGFDMDSLHFTWVILKIIKNNAARLSAESYYINKHTNLMNGCEGVNIIKF